MDTFHLKEREVLKLGHVDFNLMFQYAWTKFNVMRNEYSFNLKNESSDEIIEFNNEEFVSHV